ncbi:MAG: methionyl-tRNA formyltransferase [Chthonomonadales bacterium]
MRILFFGTSEFAVPILQRLASAGARAEPEWRVVAVVTQPDRPRGRGLRLSSPPVKLLAEQMGLPVLQPVKVRAASFLQVARNLQPDVLVLAAFGQIIPQTLLDLPPLGPINVHASLLPAYRGAAPIQRAIMNGEQLTGVTTMWMDATLDTGDILLQRSLPIEPDDTAGTLTHKLAQMGADLVVETLHLLSQGRCPRVPQDHTAATYAPALTGEDVVIPWCHTAEAINNRIRALNPFPGASSFFHERRLKIWRARPLPGASGDPGRITRLTPEGPEVETGSGRLVLLEVQPEGRRTMTGAEWARGARIQVGDRLTSAISG